jgi:hypothetical protein
VTVDDLTTVMCCAVGETEPTCEVEYGSSSYVCPAGCGEEGFTYFAETFEDLAGYPEAACANPLDAGVGDAA